MLGSWRLKVSEPGENLFSFIAVEHPKLGTYFRASFTATKVATPMPISSDDLEAFFWLMPHRVSIMAYWNVSYLYNDIISSFFLSFFNLFDMIRSFYCRLRSCGGKMFPSLIIQGKRIHPTETKRFHSTKRCSFVRFSEVIIRRFDMKNELIDASLGRMLRDLGHISFLTPAKFCKV